MSKNGKGRVALSVCLALSISACGGGGGGGGGFPVLPVTTPPTSGSDTPQAETPVDPPKPPMATTRYTFALGDAGLAGLDPLLTELQTPKFSGQRLFYLLPISSAGGALRGVYWGVEKTEYVHRLAPASDAVDLSRLQALGAEGYKLNSMARLLLEPGAGRVLFSKDTAANIKYEYADAGAFPMKDSDKPEFLASLNKMGSDGYCNVEVGIDTTGGTPQIRARVVREQPTTARCSFTLNPVAKTYEERVSQGNRLGADGKIFLTDIPTATTESLYVQDTAQKTVFKHHLTKLDLKGGAAIGLSDPEYQKAFVALLNEEGSKGAFPSNIGVEETRSNLVFTTAYDCTGLLCHY
ncbi:hypothetical protein SAMN05443579_107348 [Variovorax sp. PDC80]|uniref:hypothetical protein n=1 Tax=Variovorax sp. PDC80 TaxID=1882827 RepID=UPI0008F1E754|nr:hypothetical protein [Variovorax sp. PDC80]SFO96184.1 hypothetical protein SAMN05443579_107348 [Variovorax sp. PDC80]